MSESQVDHLACHNNKYENYGNAHNALLPGSRISKKKMNKERKRIKLTEVKRIEKNGKKEEMHTRKLLSFRSCRSQPCTICEK